MVARRTSQAEQIADLHDLIQQSMRVGDEFFAAQLEEFGLTLLQYAALEAIDRLGPEVAIGEVGDAIHAPPSSMTGLTNRLVGAGLVERYTPPENRRTVVLRTTPAGHELVRAIDGRWRESLETFLSGFSDDEVRQFREYVARTLANMERWLAAEPPSPQPPSPASGEGRGSRPPS
jgi:DNA-binding MarR family transcriptional regulator